MFKFLGALFWGLLTILVGSFGTISFLALRDPEASHIFLVTGGMLCWVLGVIFLAQFLHRFTQAITFSVKSVWKE
jgi:hypothetical protein